ncbi:unnamed protein product [Amoebophrya sp. A120]|nr:unnamed protein product [Amoebophrya sp. A120]|eukprot:GSA120T00019326001.1
MSGLLKSVDAFNIFDGILYPASSSEATPELVEVKFRPKASPSLPDVSVTCPNDKGECDRECHRWFAGDKAAQMEPCQQAVRAHFAAKAPLCTIM